MEGEKKPLDQLAERVDELLAVLNYIAKDLREVADKLKAAVQPVVQPASQPVTQAVAQPAAQPAVQELSVEEVASAFPEDLRKLLSFEDKGEFIMIKPTGFLGSDNFARIAQVVRERLGGEYISAGKESHFRVPKKQEVIEI